MASISAWLTSGCAAKYRVRLAVTELMVRGQAGGVAVVGARALRRRAIRRCGGVPSSRPQASRRRCGLAGQWDRRWPRAGSARRRSRPRRAGRKRFVEGSRHESWDSLLGSGRTLVVPRPLEKNSPAGRTRVTNGTEVAGQLVLASAKGSTSGAPAARTTRAAIVIVHPVSVMSSTSSTGPSAAPIAAGSGGSPRAVQRGDAIGGVRRRHGPSLGRVPQRAEIGQLAESGRAARASDEISTGWRSESSAITAVGRARPPPRRQHLHRGLHHVVGHLRVGLVEQRRSRAPQPRSVSLPITRPGAGPSPIRPLRLTPSLPSPDGHCLRGASSTPGRMSRCRVSSAAVASTSAS